MPLGSIPAKRMTVSATRADCSQNWPAELIPILRRATKYPRRQAEMLSTGSISAMMRMLGTVRGSDSHPHPIGRAKHSSISADIIPAEKLSMTLRLTTSRAPAALPLASSAAVRRVTAEAMPDRANPEQSVYTDNIS